MKYVTVYNSFDPNEIPALEQLFEENKLNYRVIKGPNNDTMPNEGIKVQVNESEKEKATYLLLGKGFKQKPPITQKNGKGKNKFWLILFLIIFVIIVIGFFVSRYMS